MTALPLQDHPLSDLHSVRVSDHTLQAEAFLAMIGRLSGVPDLEIEFLAWCESKHFSDCNRQWIWREVRRPLLGGRGGAVRWPGP